MEILSIIMITIFLIVIVINQSIAITIYALLFLYLILDNYKNINIFSFKNILTCAVISVSTYIFSQLINSEVLALLSFFFFGINLALTIYSFVINNYSIKE